MLRKTVILFAIACFSIVICTVQALSPTRSSNRTTVPPPNTDHSNSQHLTDDTRFKEFDPRVNTGLGQFLYEREQMLRAREERAERRRKEAWKNELGIGEQQWNNIQPKKDRVAVIGFKSWIGAKYSVDLKTKTFHWSKYSEVKGTKALPELTDARRCVDELVDLLRDENTRDEEIRKKVDELQKIRQRALEELPKVKRELAELLTTPRQEAVFLLLGYID